MVKKNPKNHPVLVPNWVVAAWRVWDPWDEDSMHSFMIPSKKSPPRRSGVSPPMSWPTRPIPRKGAAAAVDLMALDRKCCWDVSTKCRMLGTVRSVWPTPFPRPIFRISPPAITPFHPETKSVTKKRRSAAGGGEQVSSKRTSRPRRHDMSTPVVEFSKSCMNY